MLETINNQPDDSSYEDILRELVFKVIVIKGMNDSKQGKTISHVELGKQIATGHK